MKQKHQVFFFLRLFQLFILRIYIYFKRFYSCDSAHTFFVWITELLTNIKFTTRIQQQKNNTKITFEIKKKSIKYTLYTILRQKSPNKRHRKLCRIILGRILVLAMRTMPMPRLMGRGGNGLKVENFIVFKRSEFWDAAHF